MPLFKIIKGPLGKNSYSEPLTVMSEVPIVRKLSTIMVPFLRPMYSMAPGI